MTVPFFGPPPLGRPVTQLAPTEDEIFARLWNWCEQLFPPAFMAHVFKGFQNLTATPDGDYVVISPGQVTRTDQITHTYVPAGVNDGTVEVQRGSIYAYQVDCYGPGAAEQANGIAIMWRSGWSADWFMANDARIVPLHADEPQQLNILNGEMQYEQRFNLRLYAHVKQSLRAPQDFAIGIVPTTINVPADLLPD